MADMTLEEALAAATVDDGTETAYCTVDDDTRLVTIPDKYKKLGVESDEKAKRVWFRFPKLVGNNGVDLSAIGVRVNFRNANGEGDIYVVEDLTTDGDYVTFSWELTRKVTAYKGNVSFVVCAVKSDTDGTIKNEWNTTLNKECEVLEGLEVTEQIAQENPDIIEYILANLGGSVSSEQISHAVEEYMTTHPFTETDPTVPDWAKNPEKPTYTASDVGALPDTTKIPSKTSDLQNDSGFLTEHQDLSGYALKSEVPKSASDVGADAAGTAVAKVSEHNTASNAHNDIRLLVQGLTERLNALADSDDTTLDQMSEVVAYIKSNKSLIDAITTSKVNVSDIIDNLTTNVSNKPLSAAQGVALKALIDAIVVPTKLSELENDSGYAKTTDIPDKLPNPQKLTFAGAVTAEYDGSGAVTVTIPEGSGGSGESGFANYTVLKNETIKTDDSGITGIIYYDLDLSNYQDIVIFFDRQMNSNNTSGNTKINVKNMGYVLFFNLDIGGTKDSYRSVLMRILNMGNDNVAVFSSVANNQHNNPTNLMCNGIYPMNDGATDTYRNNFEISFSKTYIGTINIMIFAK